MSRHLAEFLVSLIAEFSEVRGIAFPNQLYSILTEGFIKGDFEHIECFIANNILKEDKS